MKSIAALVLMLTTLLPGFAQDSDIYSQLKKVATAYEAVYGFSGNLLIVQSDSSLLEASYGLADRETQVKNNSRTRFSINSISKTFTALAVLQLWEANKIDLHAPVIEYLPNLKSTWASQVTPHHLLTHTSGLPRESGIQPSDQLNFAQQLDLIAAQELSFDPGSRYQYSNGGIIILGALIEKASGLTYGDYLDQHIMGALQLSDTGYYRGKAAVVNQATPYRFTANGLEEAQRSKHLGDNAGGGLYSNPRDLYQYVLGLEQHLVLSEASTELLFKEHVQSGDTDREAYAWSIKYFGEEKIYFSAGSGYGTKSVIIRMPGSGDYIGITSNWGNTPILALLRDLYLSLRGVEVELPTTDTLAKPENYVQQLGTYEFDQATLMQNLGLDKSTIQLQEFEGKVFLDDELLTDHNGMLRLTYTDELTIRFEKSLMILEMNGQVMKGLKQ